MDLRPTVKTAPQAEPFTIAEVRGWAKVDQALDDARLVQMIRRAREAGEIHTGRSWFTQTLVLKLDAWPAAGLELELARPPVQSISSVKYYDVDGVQQTLSAALWFARTGEDDGAVVLKPGNVWPDLDPGRPNAIEVEYVAGFGDAVDAVPGPYIEGTSLLIVHLYENRSQEQSGTNMVPLVYGLDDLWAFRRLVAV